MQAEEPHSLLALGGQDTSPPLISPACLVIFFGTTAWLLPAVLEVQRQAVLVIWHQWLWSVAWLSGTPEV